MSLAGVLCGSRELRGTGVSDKETVGLEYRPGGNGERLVVMAWLGVLVMGAEGLPARLLQPTWLCRTWVDPGILCPNDRGDDKHNRFVTDETNRSAEGFV